jgi:hypothetical protein
MKNMTATGFSVPIVVWNAAAEGVAAGAVAGA